MKEAIKQTGPPVDSINIKIGTSEMALLRKHPSTVSRHHRAFSAQVAPIIFFIFIYRSFHNE
jgi:hypothetical protein